MALQNLHQPFLTEVMKSSPKHIVFSNLPLIAQLCAAIILVVGGWHLWGWYFSDTAQQGLTTITMKTNAALSFFLLGLGLLVILPRVPSANIRRIGARACATIVMTIGLLTL